MHNHILSFIYYPLSVICRHRRPGPLSTICRHRWLGPLSIICCGRNRDRSHGFTLVELLVVVAVIGILVTLVTGAAQRALGLARARNVEVSRQVLETALLRYRTDYNEWPDDLEHGNASSDEKTYTYSGTANKYVLSPLRYISQANSRKIRYIDETAFLTEDGSGFKKISSVDTSDDIPFVYRSRSGKKYYFEVVINADDDMASVKKDRNDNED